MPSLRPRPSRRPAHVLRPRLIAALLAGLPGSAALAQDAAAAAAPPPATERVVVTGTRVERRAFDVPASVDRLDAEVLGNDRAGLNLAETLGLLPGVTARDRQNWAQDIQVSIRGFGARSSFGIRGVRVLVDGIPATLPDGQGQVSHVDLSSADRIEVLRGPFSALYGNSSGGVISVFTRDPSPTPELGFGALAGSRGTMRATLSASGTQGPLGYVLSASHFETDGPREHSAAQRDNGNAKLVWQPGADTRITVLANAVDLPAQDPLGLTRAQFESDPQGADPAALNFDTRKTVDQTQGGVLLERRLGPQARLQWLLYGGSRRTEQFQAIPTGPQNNPLHPGGVIRLGRDYGGSDLRVTLQPAAGDAWSVVAGLSYDRLREQRRGLRNFVGDTLGVEGELRRDETNTSTALDPYVQASWRAAPRWRLDLGVRRSTVKVSSQDRFIDGTNGDDSGSVRFSATSPVAGVLFEATPQLHLYGAYGRGFETPTLNELAYRPDGSAGLNLALRPSTSRNLEAGVKWRPSQGQQWQLALFDARTRDELVVRTNSGGRATYQNATDTRRRGVELGWGARFGDWRAQMAATWLDAVYREGFAQCAASPCTTPTQQVPAGQRIPGIARGSAAASLDWAPATGWRAGVEARYSSGVPVNDIGSDAAPSHTVAAVHAGWRAQWGAASFNGFLRVDNLFDRRYAGSVIVNESNGRYFEPAPGRSLAAGFDLRWTY